MYVDHVHRIRGKQIGNMFSGSQVDRQIKWHSHCYAVNPDAVNFLPIEDFGTRR